MITSEVSSMPVKAASPIVSGNVKMQVSNAFFTDADTIKLFNTLKWPAFGVVAYLGYKVLKKSKKR